MMVQSDSGIIYGRIFDIQRFSIHDGPGIRTTVFLKGCNLGCLWCHNPESIERGYDISYYPEKCIGCRHCETVCPEGCHSFESNRHIFNRDLCSRCGKCAEKCYSMALEVIGKDMAVGEILKEVNKDRAFYESSGGGVTLSGGEPMVQFDFTRRFSELARENRLHLCIETNGYAPFEKYEKLLDFVDIFLYDLKETDSIKHKEYTNAPNEIILENLVRLDAYGAKTILRCPVIPGLNDTEMHLAGIGKIADQLKNVLEINIEPYHPLGISKSQHIGKEYPLKDISFPEEALVEGWIRKVQENTRVCVRKL